MLTDSPRLARLLADQSVKNQIVNNIIDNINNKVEVEVEVVLELELSNKHSQPYPPGLARSHGKSWPYYIGFSYLQDSPPPATLFSMWNKLIKIVHKTEEKGNPTNQGNPPT